MKQKSNCCNYGVVVKGDVTKYYVCLNCGRACDVVNDNGLCHKLALIRDKGILVTIIDFIRYEILGCYE